MKRAGSALGCHSDTEAWFRAIVSGAAIAGRLDMRALELDDVQWLDLGRTPVADEQLAAAVDAKLARKEATDLDTEAA